MGENGGSADAADDQRRRREKHHHKDDHNKQDKRGGNTHTNRNTMETREHERRRKWEGIREEDWEDVFGERMGDGDGNVLEDEDEKEEMWCGAVLGDRDGAGVRRKTWMQRICDDAIVIIASIGGGVQCGEDERQGGGNRH